MTSTSTNIITCDGKSHSDLFPTSPNGPLSSLFAQDLLAQSDLRRSDFDQLISLDVFEGVGFPALEPAERGVPDPLRRGQDLTFQFEDPVAAQVEFPGRLLRLVGDLAFQAREFEQNFNHNEE